jgi:hypothetical protein
MEDPECADLRKRFNQTYALATVSKMLLANAFELSGRVARTSAPAVHQ